MKAICLRCGVPKSGPLVPCRACGHVPVGDERQISWLLSDHHLTPPELTLASKKIRQGQILAPPPDLIEEAREQMNEALPGHRKRQKPIEQDLPIEDWTPELRPEELMLMDSHGPPGAMLSSSSMGLLVIANLLASPLVGWFIWASWRSRSPQAAHQVLKVTIPITIITSGIWLTIVISKWKLFIG